MKIERNLFIPGKLDYVRGVKPDVPCILCAIRDGDEQVVRLEVGRTKRMVISLNLFPYNPGHLLIFPLRHITDLREMSEADALEIHRLLHELMDILESVYGPRGFNIGYNVGATSGASIEHLHCHIVPRHRNETGVLEIVSGGTRVIVEDPVVTLEKLREAWQSRGKKD
ncbi:MAG: HIT domain-containing protein [Candidatus Glassbacteria bacterium]|nr:HIT domain-containing protein [Candidatus Glassbacteria bacterium]